MVTQRIFVAGAVLTAALGLSACGLDKQAQPIPSGPSEFALSLSLTATPDIVTLVQNGTSTSTIRVVARDAHSQPVRGLTLILDLSGDGAISSRTLSTGSDGVATATYTAPAMSPLTQEHTVTVFVTPVGTNYDNSNFTSVSIHLLPVDGIAPVGGLIADFSFSPFAPKAKENVAFDGTLSTDDSGNIVSYDWTFGDGDSKSGSQVGHDFGNAGSYIVKLTVKDDGGRVTSKSRIVTVAAATVR